MDRRQAAADGDAAWRLLKVQSVKDFVRELKRKRAEVFVPLTYKRVELAEVDFFEVSLHVKGVRQKARKFLLRDMASKRNFAWLYPRQNQTRFLDGPPDSRASFPREVLRS